MLVLKIKQLPALIFGIPEGKRVKREFFWLAAIPIMTLLFGYWLLVGLSNKTIVFVSQNGSVVLATSSADQKNNAVPKATKPPIANVKEASGRYIVLTAYWLLICVSAAILLAFVKDWRFVLDRSSRKKALIAVSWAVFAVVLILVGVSRTYGVFHDLLGYDLLKFALRENPKYLHDFIMISTAVLLALSIPALSVGTICCLAELDCLSARDDARDLLAKQVHRLRRYLFLGSAFLVSILLLYHARGLWPAYSVQPDLAREAYVSLVNSLSLYLGVFFTTILTAIYAPTAYVLITHAKQAGLYPGGASQTSEPSKDRKPATPSIVPLESFKTLIGLFAPLLAGAFGLLGEALKSLG